jgi:hypothetical protein
VAIRAVDEIWNGRTSSVNDLGERTYTRVFRVFTDDMRTGSPEVLAAPGLPRRFDPYGDQSGLTFTFTGNLSLASAVVTFVSDMAGVADGLPVSGVGVPAGSTVTSHDATLHQIVLSQVATLTANGVPLSVTLSAGNADPGALAKEITARQAGDDEPFTWIVEVRYSTNIEQPDYGNLNPLLRPPEVSWGIAKFTRPLWKDKDGNAITNSAKEYFDPPLETEDFRITLTIERNEASYSADTTLKYVMSVNEKPFFGAAAETVKCVGIRGQRAFEKATLYWKVTYEFEVREEKWDAVVIDQGYSELKDGVAVPIRDRRTGTAFGSPQRLDGTGKPLTPGQDTVFLTFKVHFIKDFTPLNLG